AQQPPREAAPRALQGHSLCAPARPDRRIARHRLVGHLLLLIVCYLGPVRVVYGYDEPSGRKVTVDTADGSTAQFQAQRAHLRAVAYRMLGSLSEADDALQETR